MSDGVALTWLLRAALAFWVISGGAQEIFLKKNQVVLKFFWILYSTLSSIHEGARIREMAHGAAAPGGCADMVLAFERWRGCCGLRWHGARIREMVRLLRSGLR